MADTQVHGRVIRRWLLGPATVGPVLFVAAVCIGLSAAGLVSAPVAAGLALAGAAAVVVTRWATAAERITRDVVLEDLHAYQQQAQQRIEQLDRRLRADNDPRPEKMLADLRTQMLRVERPDFWADAPSMTIPQDLRDKARELFNHSLDALTRTAELWEQSRTLSAREARDSAMLKREQLIAEVSRGLTHLRQTLDSVQARRIDTSTEQLAAVRADLDRSLEVARRVEERMNELVSRPSERQ